MLGRYRRGHRFGVTTGAVAVQRWAAPVGHVAGHGRIRVVRQAPRASPAGWPTGIFLQGWRGTYTAPAWIQPLSCDQYTLPAGQGGRAAADHGAGAILPSFVWILGCRSDSVHIVVFGYRFNPLPLLTGLIHQGHVNMSNIGLHLSIIGLGPGWGSRGPPMRPEGTRVTDFRRAGCRPAYSSRQKTAGHGEDHHAVPSPQWWHAEANRTPAI